MSDDRVLLRERVFLDATANRYRRVRWIGRHIVTDEWVSDWEVFWAKSLRLFIHPQDLPWRANSTALVKCGPCAIQVYRGATQ